MSNNLFYGLQFHFRLNKTKETTGQCIGSRFLTRLILIFLTLIFYSAEFKVWAEECPTLDVSIEYPVKLLGPLADWRPQDYHNSRGVIDVYYDDLEKVYRLFYERSKN